MGVQILFNRVNAKRSRSFQQNQGDEKRAKRFARHV